MTQPTRMTCRDLVQFMMDYLSEELPDDSRAIFERHLTACPHCVRTSSHLSDTIILCREAFDVSEDEVPGEDPRSARPGDSRRAAEDRGCTSARVRRVTLRSCPR